MLLSLRMVHTGVEQILGMGDMMGRLQLIVIQPTNTESLSQTDQAPGQVSTLTGPHPGQSNCFSILSSFTWAVRHIKSQCFHFSC